MKSAISTEQESLRLSADLMAHLKRVAIEEHTSLDCLVEAALWELVSHRPNAETLEAIAEAKDGRAAGRLDISSFETFMQSINEAE